ncbi:hypothetical protein M5K25_009764 [Dendrobium thyrsiflorum]|uniref:Uncharacterized protein n=1 Tax=Dendrobium thyrsiflorum TaxID=117978 RepID=A0ABD0V7N6_DENTH
MLGRSFWSDNDEAGFLHAPGWPLLSLATVVVDSIVLVGQLWSCLGFGTSCCLILSWLSFVWFLGCCLQWMVLFRQPGGERSVGFAGSLLPFLESGSAKQEQQHDLSEARETGSLPTNDLIGRGEAKEFVMQWLRKPSNEPRTTDWYRNISLLCIVGHGGMGKTTLLQHVC